MQPEEFWQEYLQAAGLPPDTRYLDCFHFELNERLANELLALVLSGKNAPRRAACFPLKRRG